MEFGSSVAKSCDLASAITPCHFSSERSAYFHRIPPLSAAVPSPTPLTILAFEQRPELGLTGFDRETLSTRRLVTEGVQR